LALDWSPVFEGTKTSDLQAIHDNVVAFFKGTKIGAGIQSYVIFGRTVTNYSAKELLQLLSAVSNELKRRQLADVDEQNLASFGDPTTGGPGPFLPPLYPV
jgi:hypothetical protein